MQLSKVAPGDMQVSRIAPRDRLIVALDLPDVAAAEAMIVRLGDSVTFYKIGYQLAYAGGLPLIRQLADAGKQVFIDLKLHDIGNTVARGTESLAKLGATFLTVHAYPQTMKAAVDARAGSGLKILAVTVLTSYDDSDLQEAGYRLGVSDLVEVRARQADALGVDGLVCSPEETTVLRGIVGHRMSLVTPGVRPAGTNLGDQKRIMTPGRAISAGADYLVVGRPVMEAADPKAAADAIVAEIKLALA
jgi:orotidine-5'-phosphate decarboxylase